MMTIEELQELFPSEVDIIARMRHYMLLLEFQRRLALLEKAMGFPGLYPFGNYALAIKKKAFEQTAFDSFRLSLTCMPAFINRFHLYPAFCWVNLPPDLQMGLPDTYEPFLKFCRHGGGLSGLRTSVMVNNSPWKIKPLEVALTWEEFDISDEALDRYDAEHEKERQQDNERRK